MSNLGFLHTHYLPASLVSEKQLNAIIAVEYYPNLQNNYYNDFEFFSDIRDCILWHKEKYRNQNVKFTIENISVLKDPNYLYWAKQNGLISVQLYHYGSNEYFDEHYGLTLKGKKLLKVIRDCDLYLDLSHLNDYYVNKVSECFSGKLIMSHCVCKDIIEVKHPRTNAISKCTIIALAKKNCVFGIPFINDLVCNISHDTFENDEIIMNDITSQIVLFSNLVGADKVALGPDFIDTNYFSKVFGQKINIPTELYYLYGYNSLKGKLYLLGLNKSQVKAIISENVMGILKM